jgi:hypothetical protein
MHAPASKPGECRASDQGMVEVGQRARARARERERESVWESERVPFSSQCSRFCQTVTMQVCILDYLISSKNYAQFVTVTHVSHHSPRLCYVIRDHQ